MTTAGLASAVADAGSMVGETIWRSAGGKFDPFEVALRAAHPVAAPHTAHKKLAAARLHKIAIGPPVCAKVD